MRPAAAAAVLALAVALGALGALSGGVARAGGGVGSVSPGKLSRAHAAIESQCDRCHVPFGGIPAAQCLSCHARLAERIARGAGFHATVKARPCTDCHGEHHGRDAAITPAPPNPFDHRVAVFPLEGKHGQLGCDRCHPAAGAARQWVGIPTACGRCHADRAHQGTLGGECAKCHRAEAWKPATRTAADHKVSLAGGHARLTCTNCHRSGLHLVAQQTCAQCHVQQHGGTRRECETCHRVAGWKQVTYAHKFPPAKLPGKHQTAACLACHPGFRFTPTSLACSSCHDKQRPHDPLGECSKCHSATSWKTRSFDHDRPEINFPLTGRHAQIDCAGCHTDRRTFKGTRRTCVGCHADVHGPQFGGRACTDCHTTDGWKPSKITLAAHEGFKFPLQGSHARAPCAGCHKTGTFVGTATACSACHPDVRHRSRFGTQCEKCHDPTRWSHTPAFDHTTTGFRLERGHAKVACTKCHGLDGLRLAGSAAPMACQTCHGSPHGRQFGTNCTQCHNTTSFRQVPRFDHARTAFPLELRHATLACSACHDTRKQPVVNRACRTCHGDPHRGSNAFDCADCHRPDRWRIIRFDHDLTSYPLVGRHRIAGCGGCHANPNWTGVRTDCAACHAFDRPRTQDHLTKITCDDCHTPTSWRTILRR